MINLGGWCPCLLNMSLGCGGCCCYHEPPHHHSQSLPLHLHIPSSGCSAPAISGPLSGLAERLQQWWGLCTWHYASITGLWDRTVNLFQKKYTVLQIVCSLSLLKSRRLLEMFNLGCTVPLSFKYEQSFLVKELLISVL